MLLYPNIDPVAFKFGNFTIYWYGVTYLLSFLGAFWLCVFRGKSRNFNANSISDLIFYIALGIILGGRIGFILFYQPELLLENPLTLLAFWLPGRSFHGGLIGVLLCIACFCRRYKRKFLEVTDFIAPAVPIGLGLGRIGNFINGELWGKVTDVPWAMVFPHVDLNTRHPSQLYEFFLEGIVLFVILMLYARSPRKLGSISGLFLFLYGSFRCLIELFRAPDISHGYLASNWITMGHLLSFPMILLGLWLIVRKKPHSIEQGQCNANIS